MGDIKKVDIQKNFNMPRLTKGINVPQQRKVPKMPTVEPPKKENK